MKGTGVHTPAMSPPVKPEQVQQPEKTRPKGFVESATVGTMRDE